MQLPFRKRNLDPFWLILTVFLSLLLSGCERGNDFELFKVMNSKPNSWWVSPSVEFNIHSDDGGHKMSINVSEFTDEVRDTLVFPVTIKDGVEGGVAIFTDRAFAGSSISYKSDQLAESLNDASSDLQAKLLFLAIRADTPNIYSKTSAKENAINRIKTDKNVDLTEIFYIAKMVLVLEDKTNGDRQPLISCWPNTRCYMTE